MKLLPMLACLLAVSLLAACERKAAAPVKPKLSYAEQILLTHGVDYRTCFTETPLSDTQAPEQGKGEVAQQALIAIDSSGSMAGLVAGRPKMAIAKAAAQAFAEQLSADSRVGLVIFGHEGTNTAAAKGASCSAGAKLVVPPTTDRSQIASGLAALKPAGWTPLAAAIRSAAEGFDAASAGPRVLYVVSDGLETCGGDPVDAARVANQGAQKLIVNVIAFGVPTAEQAGLRQVASAGGGAFIVAQDAESLKAALRQAAQASLRTYFAETATTRAHNVVAVGAAVSTATQCVKNSLTTERDAAMAAIAQDEAGGRATPDDIAAARSLVNGRGTKAVAALVGYSEALQAQERGRASTLWARFDQLQDELSPTGMPRGPRATTP